LTSQGLCQEALVAYMYSFGEGSGYNTSIPQSTYGSTTSEFDGSTYNTSFNRFNSSSTNQASTTTSAVGIPPSNFDNRTHPVRSKSSGTCQHPNCQAPVRQCHFHTCPHCGADKRFSEEMCSKCMLDPNRGRSRNTGPGQAPPVGQVYLPNIPETSIKRIHCIGGGTHSSVHECLYDGILACEKVLLRNDTAALVEEASVMAQIDRHPNLLRLYGICRRSNGETSIILELMQYDLLDMIRSINKHMPKAKQPEIVPTLVEFIAQCANGLRHMHRHGIVHRDLAARNMLFMNDVIKVADFGLAKACSNRSTHGLPKPLSTAPECIKDLENPDVWVPKCDIWSFGLMLCEIFALGADPLEEFHHSVPALMEALSKGWLPQRPALCPSPFWDLILSCLRQKASERPSMEDITAKIAAYQGSQRLDERIKARKDTLRAKKNYYDSTRSQHDSPSYASDPAVYNSPSQAPGRRRSVSLSGSGVSAMNNEAMASAYNYTSQKDSTTPLPRSRPTSEGHKSSTSMYSSNYELPYETQSPPPQAPPRTVVPVVMDRSSVDPSPRNPSSTGGGYQSDYNKMEGIITAPVPDTSSRVSTPFLRNNAQPSVSHGGRQRFSLPQTFQGSSSSTNMGQYSGTLSPRGTSQHYDMSKSSSGLFY